MNILQAYISDFVQDEEDTDLQQMLTVQVGGLGQMFQQEMARFIEPGATPRGE